MVRSPATVSFSPSCLRLVAVKVISGWRSASN